MSKEYPCVYFEKDGVCRKLSSDTDFQYCVMGPCPEQKLSNADRIRAMSDEELLDFMLKSVANAYMCKIMRTEPMFLTLEWLQQSAEEILHG